MHTFIISSFTLLMPNVFLLYFSYLEKIQIQQMPYGLTAEYMQGNGSLLPSACGSLAM